MAPQPSDTGHSSDSGAPLGSPRRFALVALALVALTLVADLTREPSRQITAAALLAGIDVYQRRVSPWASAFGARCRFEPSCSHYGEAVIRRYGAVRGSWLAFARIARCGPWTPSGTEDPPPRV